MAFKKHYDRKDITNDKKKYKTVTLMIIREKEIIKYNHYWHVILTSLML